MCYPTTLPLSTDDVQALYAIKARIDQQVPEYPGNGRLLFSVYPHLNTFKLQYGFRRLFGTNPYHYYQQRRFELAQRLLARDYRVEAVAFYLEYGSATTFIKAFKSRFGMTPKVYQQNICAV